MSTNNHFQDGCHHAQQGLFLEASKSFSLVSFESEEYPRAQYLLGCALNHLDQLEYYRQSLSAFHRSRESFRQWKKKIPLDLYYQQGFAEFHCGIYFDAVQNLTLFIEKSDEDRRCPGYFTRGQIYLRLSHYKEALEDFNRINENKECQSYYSLCLQGRTLCFLHQFDQGMEYFQRAVKLPISPNQGHFPLGIIHSELGEYSQALEEFDQALQTNEIDDRSRAELFFRQGLVFYATNDFHQAKKKFSDAIQLNPKHSRTHLYLSRLYLEEQKSFEVYQHLSRAYEYSPYDREILDEFSSFYRSNNQRRLALQYQSEALRIEQLDLSNLILNDDEEEEEEEEEVEEIGPKRILHEDFLWSVEHEMKLSISDNRLVLFEEILQHYDRSIGSGQSPESRIFKSLCQERENHLISAFNSMKDFYRDVEENSQSKENWRLFLDEFDEHFSGEKSDGWINARYSVLERVERCRIQLEKDRAEFHKDPSENRQIFFRRFQDQLMEFFISLSILGRNSLIRTENLKKASKRIQWMCEYLTRMKKSLPNIESTLKFKSKFDRVEEKYSLISAMADLTDLFQISEEVSRTITERYKTQLLRVDPSSNGITHPPELRPIERLADFAVKFLMETIRDKTLDQLDLKRNSPSLKEDFRNCLIEWTSVARANFPLQTFPFRKNEFDNILPIRMITSPANNPQREWFIDEFFRCPGIVLPNGNLYGQAIWMNSWKYGHRPGTVDNIRFIEKHFSV